MLKINTKIDDVNVEKWYEFVKNHPYGNIFQTPQIVELYKETKNYNPVVLIAEDEVNILGVLVGVIQKEFKGILGYFTARCIVYGGPLVKNDDSYIIERLLLDLNQSVSTRVIYTQFRNFFDLDKARLNFEKVGFKYEPHLDIHIDLKQQPKEYWIGLKSKLRQNIRKAEKKGIRFEQIANRAELEEGYSILNNVYNDAGLPLPDFSFFLNAYGIFTEKGNAAFFKATYKEEIVGVRFVLLYNNLVFDWYAGSKKEYYKYYPNDFLIYRVLEWGMKNEQYKLFDFGGAGKPNVSYGVRDHKLKFSDNLIEFGRYERIYQRLIYKVGLMSIKAYGFMKKR